MKFETDHDNQIEVKPGQVFISLNPYSEMCMHMRVAGKLQAKYITTGKYPMVQLLKPDAVFIPRDSDNPAAMQFMPLELAQYSAPITLGEGGVYYKTEPFYSSPDSPPVNKISSFWYHPAKLVEEKVEEGETS